MNTMLTLKLMEYKSIISMYKKQKNAFKKSSYVSDIIDIRSSIVDNLTEDDLSFETLFKILRKYEKYTSSKITFSLYRYNCYDDIYEDETMVDALKIRKKHGFKTSEKLVSFFPKQNYNVKKEEFVISKEIKPCQVIGADIFVVLEALRGYKKDYEKIVNLIIKHLLYNSNI